MMLQGFLLRRRAEKKEDVEELVNILMEVWNTGSSEVDSRLAMEPFPPTMHEILGRGYI